MKTNNTKSHIMLTIIWVVIPLILIACAVLAGILYYREVSFSTLQYQHPIALIQFSENDELIPGNMVRGEFIARDNNLGALGIKVKTFNRINITVIAFQLREKGQDEWYCYNTYFTDRWPNDELYPFGFPVIKDSAGKTYEFELYAGTGEPGNAIGFVKDTKFFVSRYTFDKYELLDDRPVLIEFLRKKAANLSTNINYIMFLGIFMIPLIIYILIVMNWKKVKKIETGLIRYHLILFFILITYIFYPVLMKKDIVLFIAFLILAISLIFRMSYKRVFSVAAFLILLCPLWLFIQKEEMANRSAELVFFLMIDGLVLLAKDLYFPKK